jgi:hypothetical protein
MVTPRDDRTEGLQQALELRHAIELLAERCRRLYEEANEVVERLRELPAADAPTRNAVPAHDPVRRWSSGTRHTPHGKN